jgi:hypothetical protein
MSKRRRTRALLVALIDRVEWGPPRSLDRPVELATKVGACPACSTVIDVGDEIQSVRVGPLDAPIETWVHVTCPPWWEIVSDLIEDYDDLIVTQVVPEGRRVASCGHNVGGGPVYLVRHPTSLREHNHSYWLCEGCVTR